jgi:hypothetical protein
MKTEHKYQASQALARVEFWLKPGTDGRVKLPRKFIKTTLRLIARTGRFAPDVRAVIDTLMR